MWYLAKMVRWASAEIKGFFSQTGCWLGVIKEPKGFSNKTDLAVFKVSKKHLFAGSPQIRGMSIDQAIAQLEFNDKKGAKIMREV